MLLSCASFMLSLTDERDKIYRRHPAADRLQWGRLAPPLLSGGALTTVGHSAPFWPERNLVIQVVASWRIPSRASSAATRLRPALAAAASTPMPCPVR